MPPDTLLSLPMMAFWTVFDRMSRTTKSNGLSCASWRLPKYLRAGVRNSASGKTAGESGDCRFHADSPGAAIQPESPGHGAGRPSGWPAAGQRREGLRRLSLLREVLYARRGPEEVRRECHGRQPVRALRKRHAAATGPARGDLDHWRFETVDLAPQLKAGENVLAAVVWNFAGDAPMAQVTYQNGFLLQGDTKARSRRQHQQDVEGHAEHASVTLVPIDRAAIFHAYTSAARASRWMPPRIPGAGRQRSSTTAAGPKSTRSRSVDHGGSATHPRAGS